jgi:hypothetical protein
VTWVPSRCYLELNPGSRVGLAWAWTTAVAEMQYSVQPGIAGRCVTATALAESDFM